MTLLQALILGLVEGVTEYLPISSTGHLIIASSFLGLDTPSTKPAIDAFNIIIQGGAILAVLLLYWPRFLSILRDLLGRSTSSESGKGLALAINLALAFLPAAILGPLLDHTLELHLFHPGPVVAALALGGLFMILIEQLRQGRLGLRPMQSAELALDDLTPLRAFIIGLAQCVAMIPGTSRSMMTISAGVLTGLKPRAAAEFSFLLGVPTLGAACIYKLIKDLLRSGKPLLNNLGQPLLLPDGSPILHHNIFHVLGPLPILVGFFSATISAFLAVRWLVGFLNRKGLTPFGVYRLLLALAMIGLLLGGQVRFHPQQSPLPPANPAPDSPTTLPDTQIP